MNGLDLFSGIGGLSLALRGIMSEVILICYMGFVLRLSYLGIKWLLGFGHKKRHDNWASESSMKRDPRYSHYFK